MLLRRIDFIMIKRQQGAVLLVLAVLVSVISLGWVYAGMSSHRNADVLTSKALSTAKSALIGRADFDVNHPGSLPCPDINNDGIAETTVGMSGGHCPNYIGRLPWRTLGLSDTRDSNGEHLWYALSSDARDYQYLPINSKLTTGLLQVDGVPQVAVIFAPGRAISPQQRGDQDQQNAVVNYLEGENANGDNLFVSQFQSDPFFNDKLQALSSSSVFRKVERLVLQQIAASLTQYQSKGQVFPYAAPNSSGYSQANLVGGYIPYKTLAFTSTVLADNNWFDAIAVPPALPYIVSVARDNVQINLQYCNGNMTLNTAMVVKCV